jgi:hypothetical protein
MMVGLSCLDILINIYLRFIIVQIKFVFNSLILISLPSNHLVNTLYYLLWSQKIETSALPSKTFMKKFPFNRKLANFKIH